VGDETTRIRLILYKAGWKAFQDSPWIGHGWANLMSSIRPYLAASDLQHDSLPQLHNDMLDFAVVGGVVGIAVYLLLLATPVIAAWRSVRDSQYSQRLLGCVLLSIGYFFAGLTDLMFGFELHTALYVALSAVLLGYCRDAPIAPVRQAAADAPKQAQPVS
jgi:O-antigen ligase